MASRHLSRQRKRRVIDDGGGVQESGSPERKWSTDKLLCGLRCSDRNGAHHELALAHPQTVLPLLCRHKTYGVRPTSTPATPTGHPIGTQGDENTSRSAPAREQAAPADGCHAAE